MILAAGTGSPFVTTDTAAANRALELEADALLKATRGIGERRKTSVNVVQPLQCGLRYCWMNRHAATPCGGRPIPRRALSLSPPLDAYILEAGIVIDFNRGRLGVVLIGPGFLDAGNPVLIA